MKRSLFLFLTGLLCFFSGHSYAQDTEISINLKDVTVGTVLSHIEDQSGFYFLYSNKLIDANRKVTIKVKKKGLNTVLDLLFVDTDVEYALYDKQIILTSGLVLEAIRTQNISSSQHRRIQGMVVDSLGNRLPGVNISIKGDYAGTITDVSGNFHIDIADTTTVLVFSYIGYITREFGVGEQNIITVELKKNIRSIEEVVIIGYGTQKKINLTGSVAVVAGEELTNRPVENVSLLLQGVTPNLNIRIPKEGGEPGAVPDWNIRGYGTLSGSDAPLILVDGMEMDVNSLNPESIESVSVLKDAAASAIYGARAPFGVVLITTKRGKKNQEISLSYNNNFGFASPIRIPHFESSLVLATAFNQASDNSGRSHKFPDAQLERIRQHINGSYLPEYDTAAPIDRMWGGRHEGNANYEWMGEYWKENSFRQKHDISLEGGGEKTRYYISGGLYDQDGLYNFGYDSYKRYNLLANVTSQVTKWLRFDLKTKYSQVQTDYPLGMLWQDRYYMLRSMPTFWPTLPMYNYGVDKSNDVLAINNPIIRIMQGAGRDITTFNDSWLSLGTEIEPVKGWLTNISYNYNYFGKRNTSNPIPVPVYYPSGNMGNIGPPVSSFSTVYNSGSYSLFNVTSSYQLMLGSHFIKAMFGYEQESALQSELYGTKTNLISIAVPSISTASGEVLLDDSMSHWSTQALFSRISYNYKEKYLVEFNARYNGSSRFAPDQRWGFFPSLSAGYNISKEEFWKGIQPIVNSLKLRVSYGSLGNQNVPNYLYLPNLPVESNLDWIMGDERPDHALTPALVSNELTWETVTTLNMGMDAGLVNNRLKLGVDWYKRTTRDMIGPAKSQPAILGAVLPLENNAEMETRGWELSLTWKDRVSSDFVYYAGTMIGDSKSTILKYINEDGTLDDWYAGKEIGEIWGYISDGLIQQEDEVMADQSRFYPNWGPGDMKYRDLDGNNIINDGTRTLDSHGDLTVIGNMLPRYNFNISAGLIWNSLDINMFWQGVGKHQFYPEYTWASSGFWGLTSNPDESSFFTEGHADYWRPEDETNILGPNTDAYYPKPYFSDEDYKNKEIQTKYLQNAAYLRLKTLQIGYTIPVKLVNRIEIEKLRIYFSGENLLTLTKLTKLLDPETAVVTGELYGGMGIGRAYPLSRIISFGLNVTF